MTSEKAKSSITRGMTLLLGGGEDGAGWDNAGMLTLLDEHYKIVLQTERHMRRQNPLSLEVNTITRWRGRWSPTSRVSQDKQKALGTRLNGC